MAKKKASRKKASLARTLPQGVATPAGAQPRAATPPRKGAEASQAAPIILASRETIAQAQASFGEEYRYVLTDLKRIGLLAAGMFALLIVLALLIR